MLSPLRLLSPEDLATLLIPAFPLMMNPTPCLPRLKFPEDLETLNILAFLNSVSLQTVLLLMVELPVLVLLESVPSVVKLEQQDLTSVKTLAEVISEPVSEVSEADKVVELVSDLAPVSVASEVVAAVSTAPAPVIALKMATRVATSEAATTAASPSGEKFKTCLLLVELSSPD